MSAKDKLIDLLLDRVSESIHRAITAERLFQQLSEQGVAKERALRAENTEIQNRFNALVKESRAVSEEANRLRSMRDAIGKNARAYEELHRVVLDAHSLIDREDLPDADKVKSIHGLMDQVLGMDWFAGSPHARDTVPPKARRAPRKAAATKEIAIEEPRDASEDDAPEYVTPDGKFDAEAEDEDAREFNRDY